MSVRVLLTGEHGYIGSVMRRVLEEAGHDVVGLDSMLFDGCDFPVADTIPTRVVRDLRDLRPEDLEGYAAVVHLAALSNDPMGDLDPALTRDINEVGSLNLARCAKEGGVRRFVFSSSCSMYGTSGTEDEVAENAPLRPLTPYAESKVRFEEDLWGLAGDGFAPVSMRNATAYGVSPRLRLDVVLNNLTAWAHVAGSIRLQSDGRSVRPLVHVEDISRAAVTLLQAPADAVDGKAFNIGAPGENYVVRDLADLVAQRYPAAEVSFAEGAGRDPRSYRVDFSLFAETFPQHRFLWTAHRGVDELGEAFAAVGLRQEDLTGERYIRLQHIAGMRERGQVDASLRPLTPSAP